MITTMIDRSLDADMSSTDFEREWRFAPSTLARISDVVLVVEPTNTISYCNPAAASALGLSEEQILSSSIRDVWRSYCSNDSRASIESLVQSCFETGNAGSAVVLCTNRQSSGDRPLVTISVSRTVSDVYVTDSVIVILDATTSLKQDNARLSWEARHDALTSVFNRREIVCRLERILIHQKRSRVQSALLFLDLDHFKFINDVGGHGAGDAMLRLVADTLKRLIHGNNALARVGGDEFVILLEQCPVQEAIRVSQTVLRLLDDIRLEYEERTFRISASIGVVPIDDSIQSASQLLTCADNACYDRKRRGRRGFSLNEVQQTSLPEISHVEQDIDVEKCLEEDLFTLFAQPIVDTAEPTQIVGIEILLRHESIEQGLQLPDTFFHQIERLGLHAVVDQWVLEHTIDWMKNNRQLVDALEFVSVNLTPTSLMHRGFVQTAKNLLISNADCAHKVCFELTEHERLNLHTDIRDRLHDFRQLGCRFAIDDFGSGWHQLDQIRDLPVDIVKISGHLANRMTDDLVDRTVIRSIHEVSKLLRKRTVLEHVSNEVIVADAREIGIDLCQGRFVAQETPLDDFQPHVSNRGLEVVADGTLTA